MDSLDQDECCGAKALSGPPRLPRVNCQSTVWNGARKPHGNRSRRHLRPQRKALCLQQSNRSLCCLGAGPSAAAALLENVVHGLVLLLDPVNHTSSHIIARLPSTFATVDIEPPRKLLEISPRVIQSTFRTETDFAGKWLTIQS
ncbi:hypothetical protein DTO282F9_688 [Paecilomyces variotii]|nr:hypothetical protein DTO282F9_688 [Paecilomyces variotii]